MSKLVVLRRCATVAEAIVIDSALKAGGLQSSLGEYYFAHIHPASGGVSVFVPDIEFEQAQQHLIELKASAVERLTDEFGAIGMAQLKLRKVRAWILLVFFCTPVEFIIYIALAFLLSLLPIDWATLVQNSTPFVDPFFGFGPVASQAGDTGSGHVPLRPGGGCIPVRYRALYFMGYDRRHGSETNG